MLLWFSLATYKQAQILSSKGHISVPLRLRHIGGAKESIEHGGPTNHCMTSYTLTCITLSVNTRVSGHGHWALVTCLQCYTFIEVAKTLSTAGKKEYGQQ